MATDGGGGSGYCSVAVGVASVGGGDVALGRVGCIPIVCNSFCLSRGNCKSPRVTLVRSEGDGVSDGAGGGDKVFGRACGIGATLTG